MNDKTPHKSKESTQKFDEKSFLILNSIIESPRNVVIFALDRQYRYLAFNQLHHQTMKQIWGVDIASGSCMLDYIKDPDDRLKAKQNFDRVLLGESFSIEEEYGDKELERRFYEDIYNPIVDADNDIIGLTLILRDITDRKKLESEKDLLIKKLRSALDEVKTLTGMLPICAKCKKIRDDNGYWKQVESYIQEHSEAEFSHSICPDCMREMYPQFADKIIAEGVSDE